MFKHLLICMLPISQLSASWIDKKAEGWAWYEDKPEETKEEQPKKLPITEIEHVKKKLEAKLSKALLNPTEGNVQDYMQEQQKWINQSAIFANVWAKLLLAHPNLDETTRHPVSQYGIQLQKHITEQKRRVLIEELARNNGLFFFYEGRSKQSQAFAEVVISFAEKYGWTVVPVAVDETLLPEFPLSKFDNGISEKLNANVFPSLYIVDPNAKIATPIAYGLATLSDIEKNIDTQYTQEE